MKRENKVFSQMGGYSKNSVTLRARRVLNSFWWPWQPPASLRPWGFSPFWGERSRQAKMTYRKFSGHAELRSLAAAFWRNPA